MEALEQELDGARADFKVSRRHCCVSTGLCKVAKVAVMRFTTVRSDPQDLNRQLDQAERDVAAAQLETGQTEEHLASCQEDLEEVRLGVDHTHFLHCKVHTV